MNLPQPTVTVQWLNDNLDHPDLILLDASLPKPKSNPGDNPLANLQIPGSRFFDIDNAFADPETDLPHMMPSVEQFTIAARNLGINKNSIIVVYDNLGVYSSPRAWWMLLAMGHNQVSVLDGGLPEWENAEFETEEKRVLDVEKGDFDAHFDQSFFRDSTHVLNRIESDDSSVVDARSSGRFAGTKPEPRAGLRGGHIPNSKNLPFPDVLNGTRLKSKDELQVLFNNLDLPEGEVVFSCGSGLTACILTLAASITERENLSVYDGSWSEWGQPSDLPVITS